MSKTSPQPMVFAGTSSCLLTEQMGRVVIPALLCVLAHTASVIACPGDADGKGEVGLGDFAWFDGCCNGPDQGSADPACEAFDFDRDDDVDLADFRVFQSHFGACPCEPQWAEGLFPVLGTSGPVHALLPFDDGTGPLLYVGGSFAAAGDIVAHGIAGWDGTSWSPLGNGLGSVHALTVFDDGTGPALYAGGGFKVATEGTTGANHIAKWDGASWLPLADGLNGTVYSLAVFDDGTGPALFAGGEFSLAGGQNAGNIAKWDGAVWTGLGEGTDGVVTALAVFNDGTRARLYVGGDFTVAGGENANYVAAWDGSSWSTLEDGLYEAFPWGGVQAMTAFDDGTGLALYVGGVFGEAGGVTVRNVAKWDGISWATVREGLWGPVRAFVVGDNGGDDRLYAADGESIMEWDGATWMPVGSGVLLGNTYALAFFGDHRQPTLFAGGDFELLHFYDEGVALNNFARFDGSSWSALGEGIDASVRALATFDDGTGAAMYVGGSFAHAGDVEAVRAARWDGTSWSSLGEGLGHSLSTPRVQALAFFHDGSGSGLYAGKERNDDPLALWNGGSWAPVDAPWAGMAHPDIRVLQVFDYGGPALYVGGQFQMYDAFPEEVSAWHIARWDGISWSSLGDGVLGGGATGVDAMTVFNDGTGPALYAGGVFRAPETGTRYAMARWDGYSWSIVDDWENGWVRALAVFDDGGGPALYAGGEFRTAGDVVANDIAKWDGTSWSPLGDGLDCTDGHIYALTVFDDGTGEALYAAGSFSSVDGVNAARIARWDGVSWSPLGAGLNSVVRTLLPFDDGTGPALYVGGDFSTAGGAVSAYIAKWYRPAPPCP